MNPATIVPQRFQLTAAAVPTTSSNNLSELRYVPLAMNPNNNNNCNNNNKNLTESVGEATGGLTYPVVATTISLATPLPAVAPCSILTVIPATLIPPAMAFVNAEKLQLSSNGVVGNDDALRTAAMHPILITTSADSNGGGGTNATETATLAMDNCYVVGAENGDAGEVNLISTTMPEVLTPVSHANSASASAAAAIMQAGSGNTSSILLCNQQTFGNGSVTETRTNSKPHSFDVELLKQIVVGNAPNIKNSPPQQLPPAKQQQKLDKKPVKNQIRPQQSTSLLAPAPATSLLTSANSQLKSAATYADLYNSRLSLPARSELSKIRRRPGDIVEDPQNNNLSIKPATTLIKKLPTNPVPAGTVLPPKKASSNVAKFPITEPLPINTNIKLLTKSIMTTDATVLAVTSLPDVTITTTPAMTVPTVATSVTAASTTTTAFNCASATVAIAANDGVVVVEDDDELPQKCEPQASSHKVPTAMYTNATEKQESLLKSTPKPKNMILIETKTSPRSKQRAVSLNSAPAVEIEDVASGERRHSHPTEKFKRANCTLDMTLEQDGESDTDCEEVQLIDVDQEYMDVLENTNTNKAAAESHELENGEQAQSEIKPKQAEQENIEVSTVKNAQTLIKNRITIDQQQQQQQQEVVKPSFTSNSLKIEHTAAVASSTNSVKLEKKEAAGGAAVNTANSNTKVAPPIDTDDCEILLIPIPNSKENSIGNQSLSSTLLDKSLLCEEKISLSSSSSSSTNNSLNLPTSAHAPRPLRSQTKPQIQLKPQAQLLKAQSKKSSPPSASITSTSDMPTVANSCPDDSLATVVTMLSAFNMLNWKERFGTARSTNMRFVLNDFNLVQLHERCVTRNNIHTAYEKPISERTQLSKVPNQQDPLLYMCKRCNCYGPAADFLAPDYCSLACLKRTTLKRQRDATCSAAIQLNLIRKRSRKEPPAFNANHNSMQLTQNRSSNPPCKRIFRWSTYMTAKCEAIAAPVDLFLNPFPSGANRFTIGMKLEAIDPANCSLFCVATVVDIQGYRLKLNMDGYAYMYDFWVNADSMDIFPPGWCAKTGRTLQPPKDVEISQFNWTKYINEKKAPPAPRGLFTHLNSSSAPTQNPFKIGMHLEAEDLNDTGKLCVATVADILDNRIRIHFDGWAECYDYWVDINSPYIHPCGWHRGRRKLFVPPGLENTRFTWPDYIKCKRTGMAAPVDIFAPRNPIEFKPDMKLEVVDPRNTSLIRPATINSCHGHRVKLHLDGWASDYCFWLEDDSPDLHPMGWCDATGHELEPPPGYKMRPIVQVCHINGCRGIGNAKEFYLNSHSSSDCCPYEPSNWSKKVEKPKRIEPDDDHVHAVPRPTKTAAAKAKAQYLKRGKPMDDELRTKPNAIQPRHIAPARMQYEAKALRVRSSQQPLKAETTRVIKNEQYAVTAVKREVETIECIDDDDDDIPSCSAKSRTSNVNNASTSSSSSSSTSKTYDETEIKIAKQYLNDYGPRLQQNYDIWVKNSSSNSFNIEQIKRNPLYWNTTETCAFVELVLNSHTIAMSFQHQEIDGEALLLLCQTDLTDILKMRLGPAVKLYSCILQLRTLVVRKFGIKPKLEC